MGLSLVVLASLVSACVQPEAFHAGAGSGGAGGIATTPVMIGAAGASGQTGLQMLSGLAGTPAPIGGAGGGPGLPDADAAGAAGTSGAPGAGGVAGTTAPTGAAGQTPPTGAAGGAPLDAGTRDAAAIAGAGGGTADAGGAAGGAPDGGDAAPSPNHDGATTDVATDARAVDGVPPDARPALVSLNAGGLAIAPFGDDMGFVGGGPKTHLATIDVSGVVEPAPLAVYQTARVGAFVYTLPGFAPGSTHVVRLHFAEPYFSTAGQRVCDISAGGVSWLKAFDIVGVTGVMNKAIIEQAPLAANASGAYVLQFKSVTDQCLVCGIEIR